MLIAEPLFPFRLCVPADAEGGEGGAALLAACVWNQRWLLVTVAGAAPKPPVVQHTLPSSLHSESRSPLKPPGLRQTSTP